MNRSILIAALVAVLAFGSTAIAQTPVGPTLKVAVVPVAGLAVASGDISNAYNPSLAIGGELDLKVGPMAAITGSVIYNEFSAKAAALGVTDKAKTLEFGAGLKYNFVPTPVAKPFLRVGAGMYHLDFGDSTSTSTKFGINSGAGVDIDLPASKLGFTADARYHYVFTSGNTKWKYFNIYGGIRFSLM